MPIESEPIVNILDPETIVNISETDVNCESQEANIELDMIRNLSTIIVNEHLEITDNIDDGEASWTILEDANSSPIILENNS